MVDTQLDKPTIPETLTARIPEKLKADIAALMLLEKRKISNVAMMLIEEGIPVKKKVHDHRHQLMPIVKNSIEVIRTQRHPLEPEGGDFKMRPGLFIGFIDGVKSNGFILTKEEALIMAANLSIFLNEVTL